MFYLGSETGFSRGGDIATPAEIKAIRGQLAVKGEFARRPALSLDTDKPFRRAMPMSESDSVDGRICTKSKMWFPGHRLVMVGGLPYGDIFAPQGNSL